MSHSTVKHDKGHRHTHTHKRKLENLFSTFQNLPQMNLTLINTFQSKVPKRICIKLEKFIDDVP